MRKKQATIDALNLMIQHADKGPSGFWTDDYEGCGNPSIFPEFEEGLKKGRLVQKEHHLCTWNTAVMYGAGHGNISSGCYYSCSIERAKYLSEQELREILSRFKTRLENGDYDSVDRLPPLLTTSEDKRIKERIFTVQFEKKRREELKRQDRLKKAAELIVKYPNEASLLAAYYGESNCVIEEGGCILFDPASQADVVGAEKMSYNEYLDVQLASLGKHHRSYFADCFFNIPLEFTGQIEKVNAKHICFKRISISGMFSDGEMFDGKEDHVWMDRSGFEEFRVGDSVSFGADVYRYVKTGNGKLLDYGLRNPKRIQKIEAYEFPSDDALIIQDVRMMSCDTCFLSEQCNGSFCMINSKQKRSLEQETVSIIKSGTYGETQK